MATIPTIQLFRNSIIKTGRQAAIDALEAQKASVPDGGLILARYSKDGTENGVKTLLGIVRNSGSANAELTVIDVEGAAENVQTAITNAINKLNKADTEEVGQYVSSVSEENGIITVTRKPLPSFDEKTNSGKAITAITQTNGEVSVKFGGVAAANVSVADTSDKFTANTVEGALLEIKTSLDNAIGTGGSVETQITNKINTLNSEESGTSTSNHITVGVKQVAGKITSVTVSDSDIASAELLGTITDTKDKATAFGRIAQEAADRTAAIEAMSLSLVSGTGKVITAITQTNGVVNATADTLSASSVLFRSSGTSFTADNVKDALDTLYTRSGDGSKVTLEDAEGSEGSNVLKVYTIKQGGTTVGTINIPKDLVVTSGSVVKGTWDGNTFTEDVSGSGTALKLVIANQTNPVYINTLDLVKDHTGGNGIAISDTNVISVVKDPDSDSFLTIGKNGVKLSGVQAAISEASGHVNTIIDARLGTGVTSDSTATAQFAELSNKLGTGVTTAATETVTAQLQALSGSSTSDTSNTISVIGAKKYTDAKIEALDFGPVGGTGKVITAISQENGLVSASTIELTASNVQATPFVSGDTKVAVDGATVSAQIESLATSIKSASTAAAAAHTVVNAKLDGHVKVTVSSENSHDVVTITEDDIASAAALATETNARQTQDDKIEESIGLDAEGNHKTTTGNYTNGATTVVGEIAALDTKLKEVSDTLGTGVSTAATETVTEQLQALSGRTGDASGVTSVEGAKAYAKDLVENLDADVESTTESTLETTTTKAIRIKQTDGKIASITLGAFDCGTY